VKGGVRENRPPLGVEKSMLIFLSWDENGRESLYVDIGYPISEKRYRMFRGFGMFRKRGLRPWVLNILRRSPKNGAEIMDEIENMSQGWWRPSPGSVYPMLEEMVQDGLIKKRDDGRYELTTKAKEAEDEWPFSHHFTGPRSIDAMLNEITGYISYFEDLTKTDQSKLEPFKDKIRTITERLTALSK
jgi:DNA-binding PadR family transcriptional regulator